jgi:hypothetical protein
MSVMVHATIDPFNGASGEWGTTRHSSTVSV